MAREPAAGGPGQGLHRDAVGLLPVLFQSVANMAPGAAMVPLASSVLFIPVLLAAFGVNFGGLGITPLASPANKAPYIVGGWLVFGLAVLIYFLVTDRSRVARTGLVFDESAPEVQPPQPDEIKARSPGSRGLSCIHDQR